MSTSISSPADGELQSNDATSSTTQKLAAKSHAATDKLAMNAALATEQVAESAHDATERAAVGAHAAVDKAAEFMGESEQALRARVAAAEQQLSDMRKNAQEGVETNVDALKNYVNANPVKSAGIAFAAGLVLSSILRR